MKIESEKYPNMYWLIGIFLLLVLGKILELLEKYKYENNDSMNELRLMAAKQLLSVLNGKDELVGLLSKTVALKARFTN